MEEEAEYMSCEYESGAETEVEYEQEDEEVTVSKRGCMLTAWSKWDNV